MEEGIVLCLGTGQEKLSFVLSDARLYVPRPAQGHLPRAQETYAGKIMFQLQEGGYSFVQGTRTTY